MLKLIKNIFWIDTHLSEERIQINLFGLKIKIVKPKYQMQRKQNSYYFYKKNNVDITTLPPATGKLRDLQLANLALLKEFDTICKQNSIHYWLDAGTLIGAIRHKGFIPWDDDIDLGIFREDYEKIMNVINNNTYNTDIYATYDKTFLKIKHKGSDLLFLDLFPFDAHGEIMSVEKQLKESKTIRKYAKALHKDVDKLSNEDLVARREEISRTLHEKVLMYKLPEDKTKIQYVWGLDFCHSWDNWFTNYEVLFPFKTIKFEGFEFPCMNNPDAFLTRVYGNYMGYPNKLRLGHNMMKEFTETDKKTIEKLIKGLN